jgi:hypothetical protein
LSSAFEKNSTVNDAFYSLEKKARLLHIKPVIIMSLLCICLAGGGCASSRSFDSSLNSIANPFRFSTVTWEAETVGNSISNWLFHRNQSPANGIQAVNDYFSLVDRIKDLKSRIAAANAGTGKDDITPLKSELDLVEKERALLECPVAGVIASQINETLNQQGIYNPVIGCRWRFPPLSFRLEKLPYLLVVSPRERIETIRTITLRPDITPEQIAEIEAGVDKLGVSSLVVDLGGYGGTYPAIVLNEADIHFTLDTAVHEWAHQYLAFTPLGFRYVLDLIGIARNYEIATINETAVSVVSTEIGKAVCERYYTGCASHKKTDGAGFYFNGEMRDIRRAVDTLLAQGQIEQAEQFMEQKRQELATHGYYIRKLNQAYFAFNGTYADQPSSISPIGAELKELRARSSSLKAFLDTVAAFTSRQDLEASIK